MASMMLSNYVLLVFYLLCPTGFIQARQRSNRGNDGLTGLPTIKPNITGRHADGKTCLKASVALSLLIKYSTLSGGKASTEISVPTGSWECACKGQTITNAEQVFKGPAIFFNWTTTIEIRERKTNFQEFYKADLPNFVVVRFDDDGETSWLANVNALIATSGDSFPDASEEYAFLDLPFDGAVPETNSGTSYTCALSEKISVETDDVTGISVKFSHIGFEIGDELQGEDFSATGTTCAAADGFQKTLLTALIAALSASICWFA